MAAKKETATRTTHTLKKSHRHGGKDLDSGAKVNLTTSQLERLKAKGVI